MYFKFNTICLEFRGKLNVSASKSKKNKLENDSNRKKPKDNPFPTPCHTPLVRTTNNKTLYNFVFNSGIFKGNFF